jgi:long-chain acyl-CoA synthetase
MSLQTLNDIFFAVAGRQQADFMLRRTDAGWAPVSSKQFASKVAGVAHKLRSWGIGRGDRVAILAENRHEWVVADFACLQLGAVVVPIYTTLTAQQIAYLLRDSGPQVIFLSSEQHLQKILSIREQTAIEKIVVMDENAGGQTTQMSEMMQFAADPAVEAIARGVKPDDLATIIYTSGTTGVPKGVMLTHGNMASNIDAFLGPFAFGPGMRCLSFLPLSHVTARSVDMGLIYRGVTLAHVPAVDQVAQSLLEIKPDILLSVPRVYEKVHAQVELQANSFPKKHIYRWAMRTGRKHRQQILAGETPRSFSWRLADRLVFSKIREGIGGRVSIYISGGAPLGLHLAEWYADVGIRIHEGYGLTETSPVIAVNTAAAHRIGSVGKPLSNVAVRIAADGEILVRAPSVFHGYWNKADETRDAFVDGWFKTGDIGRLDSDGFLYVTDRKKDLIKTSGGKFIAPQPIENTLKHNPLIAEAVVLGDMRRFPAALIFPNFAPLQDRMKDKDVWFSSREELLQLEPVRKLYAEIVQEVNETLAHFEKLKEFRLIAEELSPSTDTLTASLKVRRRAVEERFRSTIEEIYTEPKT